MTSPKRKPVFIEKIVKPLPRAEAKRIDFELIKGIKGKGLTISTNQEDFDPSLEDV